jgi:hypothetical protein
LKIFFVGCFLFCFAILLHLILWKIRLPDKQLISLLKVLCSVFILWLGLSIIFLFDIINLKFTLSFPEMLHMTLLYISLSLSYVVAYSTIEADSPSLRISMILLEKGEKGIDKRELLKALNMDQFFASRVGRLVEDKMIKEIDGGYILDSKGMILMNIVLYYRRILKISEELG